MKCTGKLARILWSGVLVLAVDSCTHLRDDDANHPLTGKLWNVSMQHFVEPAQLMQRASMAQFVLLGEIHDNKTHHDIQVQVLEQMLRAGRHPALVMEQYDRDQQDKINAIENNSLPQDDKLYALQQLMQKGWEWQAYEPLLRLALRHDLPIIAANVSRDELRRVSRQGFAVLGTGEETRLALDKVWTPDRQYQLVKEIYDGHCGKVRQPVVEAIAKAQRARDAIMADAMLKFRDGGAVAIIGSGHTRRDMAVPLYLAARAPDATLLSLGMVQVDTPRDPAAYAIGPLGMEFDYVWFTPRAYRRVNPCDMIPASQSPAKQP